MAEEEIKATPESYVAEFYKAAVESLISHLNPSPSCAPIMAVLPDSSKTIKKVFAIRSIELFLALLFLFQCLYPRYTSFERKIVLKEVWHGLLICCQAGL